MRWLETSKEILREIEKVIESLDPAQVGEMLETLVKSRDERKKTLIVGEGRSGLVGRAFAMRLMHLGFEVYVLRETITPSIGKDDLVIVISGSGRGTQSTTTAKLAKDIGTEIIAITSHPHSELGRTADHVVKIPGREEFAHEKQYQVRQIVGEHASLTPMGILFEDTCIVFLDSIVTELIDRLEISENLH